jgi:hypothetical protein
MADLAQWLRRHDMIASDISDCLAAYRSGEIPPFPVQWMVSASPPEHSPLDMARDKAFANLLRPAFAFGFGRQLDVSTLLDRISFLEPQDPGTPPHTEDRGSDAAPIVRLRWRATPEDLICLAHETGHALQIMMGKAEVMPPLAREVCAFLGEMILIEFVRREGSPLFARLRDVWHNENRYYLGRDLDRLSEALDAPETPYDYRLNYPLARLAAVTLFRRGSGPWLPELFSSGSSAMNTLPIRDLADRAAALPNNLPPMPPDEAEGPSAGAYRSLGAMTLLDIEHADGETEKSIEGYFASASAHLKTKTVLVSLRPDGKPIGYATWAQDADALVLTRQAAPFGDYMALQQHVERQLKSPHGMHARHQRSSRRDQAAW